VNDLRAIDLIRKRPGMYAGPMNDGTGLHNMVYGVVHSAISEALAGNAKRISVHLNGDGSCTVRDDGRGLSTDPYPKLGIPLAEAVMTNLYAAMNESPPEGIGLCVVNALSDWVDVHIWRSGREHQMRFRFGEIETPLRDLGDAGDRHGTEITFLPSGKFFPETTFDPERLHAGLKEIALKHAVPITLGSPE